MEKYSKFIDVASKYIDSEKSMVKEAFLGAIIGKLGANAGQSLLRRAATGYGANLGLFSGIEALGSEEGFGKGFLNALMDPATHLMTLGATAATPLIGKGTAKAGSILERIAPKKLKSVGRSMRWFSDPFYRASRSKGLQEAGLARAGGKVGLKEGIFSKVDDAASKTIYDNVYDQTMKTLKKHHSSKPIFSHKLDTVREVAEDYGMGYMKEPSAFSKIFKNTDKVKPTFVPYAETGIDSNILNPYSYSLLGSMGMGQADIPILSTPAKLVEESWNKENYEGILNSMGDKNRYNQWFSF